MSAEKPLKKNMEPANENNREHHLDFPLCRVGFFTFAEREAEEDFREEQGSKNRQKYKESVG